MATIRKLTVGKLTWEKKEKRWKKVYKGRVWHSARGMQKTDTQAYQTTVEEFQRWRAEIDLQTEASKPYRAEYEQAIKLRQAMMDWLRLEGLETRTPEERAEYDRLGKEIAQLNSDFARLHPPKLNVVGQLWIDPVAEKPASECITWYDRLDALKAYRKWTSTTDHAKTVDGNIAEYLKVKEAAARTGQIKPASYDVFIHRLAYLRRFCGTTAIDQLNARTLSGFLAHLNERIICGDIRPATAQGILRAVRSFVRWLYKTETIENWPRNLDDLHVRVELQEIIPFTRDEISKLLAGASDRTRLYLLLMLNCGFYQQDVADLAHAEVDWEQGRIIRKRSKTSKQKNVPKVNYKLWPATFELLKRFRSEHRTWVLVNENGSPLRQRGFRADGKTHNLDNIKKAYERVCDKLKRECKPLKLFRKTGASKLEEHETYGRYAQYYLGHAPDSVAESRYARPSDEQFDRALQWLGEQFDIK